jgi:hypothetical protein
MSTTPEIQARIVIAEFEARRSQETTDRKSRRWRLVATLSRITIGLAGAVYLVVSGWQVSGAQAGAFVLIGFAAAAWPDHDLREKVRSLEAEVGQLKNELKDKGV